VRLRQEQRQQQRPQFIAIDFAPPSAKLSSTNTPYGAFPFQTSQASSAEEGKKAQVWGRSWVLRLTFVLSKCAVCLTVLLLFFCRPPVLSGRMISLSLFTASSLLPAAYHVPLVAANQTQRTPLAPLTNRVHGPTPIQHHRLFPSVSLLLPSSTAAIDATDSET
jgi:hypothetical protein